MPGLPEIEVPGCEEGCEHVWGEERTTTAGRNDNAPRPGKGIGQAANNDYAGKRDVSQGQYCQRCGGWRGSYGLEPTVEAYVAHTVAICRELKRVLRDDGTLWWNLGDSYATRLQGDGWGDYEWKTGGPVAPREGTVSTIQRQRPVGLKPKDLCMIPARVALALQADGWYLRSAIIWAKGVSFCPTYSGSCMPESVRDRPTNSYEHVFLLAKSKRYFYDADAVRETRSDSNTSRFEAMQRHAGEKGDPVGGSAHSDSPYYKQTDYRGIPGVGTTWMTDLSGRNLRSVWTINPGNFPGSHFATFPPKLVEPMIKAGTSQRGCCPKCLSPWKRVTEKGESLPDRESNRDDYVRPGYENLATQWHKSPKRDANGSTTTTGWIPTCSCDAGEPVPATVLDPFTGSGTTLAVADLLNRHSVGIELSKAYCDEHIIPRLSEPLLDWAREQPEPEPEPEPQAEQLGFGI